MKLECELVPTITSVNFLFPYLFNQTMLAATGSVYAAHFYE